MLTSFNCHHREQQKLVPLPRFSAGFSLIPRVCESSFTFYKASSLQPVINRHACSLRKVQSLVGPIGEKGQFFDGCLVGNPDTLSYVDVIQTCWQISRIGLEIKLLPPLLGTKYSKNSVIAPEQCAIGNDTISLWNLNISRDLIFSGFL